jgi:hypothetical protein
MQPTMAFRQLLNSMRLDSTYKSPFKWGDYKTITVAGQTFTFNSAGKYSTQNVNFAGVSDGSAKTIPINSIGGEYYVGNKGVQSYDVYVSSSTNNQVVADDLFHEVQHAELFSQGGADGFGNFGSTTGTGVQKLHHQYMLTPSMFDSHRRFLNNLGANSSFTNRIVGSLMWQADIDIKNGKMPNNLHLYVPEVRNKLRIIHNHLYK